MTNDVLLCGPPLQPRRATDWLCVLLFAKWSVPYGVMHIFLLEYGMGDTHKK